MTAIAQLARSVLQLGLAPVRTVKARMSASGSGLVDDLRGEVRQVIEAALAPISVEVGQTQKAVQQIEKDVAALRKDVAELR